MAELESILSKKNDAAEVIVKTELLYYMHMHRPEVIASPSF